MIGTEARLAALARALALTIEVVGWRVVAVLRNDTEERREQNRKLDAARDALNGLVSDGGGQ